MLAYFMTGLTFDMHFDFSVPRYYQNMHKKFKLIEVSCYICT